jgi:hypothetical protein
MKSAVSENPTKTLSGRAMQATGPLNKRSMVVKNSSLDLGLTD